ncbi:hypothetical protein [Microbacterium azadirachtae]|uniref:hypothetical protein n=1 Tax=Microbacterium azadirachtae TaxID=582680 RepID=UPI0012E03638|nr:hypothetical protein [Microbacterium azadirachtae]
MFAALEEAELRAEIAEAREREARAVNHASVERADAVHAWLKVVRRAVGMLVFPIILLLSAGWAPEHLLPLLLR